MIHECFFLYEFLPERSDLAELKTPECSGAAAGQVFKD